MSDNKNHIYSEQIEAIRQAILEACADHDVSRQQILKDLLLWEEIEEHLKDSKQPDWFIDRSLEYRPHTHLFP